MTNHPATDDELFVHLDTAGLAALMKAIEAAMVGESGELVLGGGSGIVVRGGSGQRFSGATLIFDPTDPRDDRRRAPEPEPLPRTPVLELQG